MIQFFDFMNLFDRFIAIAPRPLWGAGLAQGGSSSLEKWVSTEQIKAIARIFPFATHQNNVGAPSAQKSFRNLREGYSWMLVITIFPLPIRFSMITVSDPQVPIPSPSYSGNMPSHSMAAGS
jgi:hypothetical protein